MRVQRALERVDAQPGRWSPPRACSCSRLAGGVTLTHGPIDISIWDALGQRARAAIPDEVLLAIIAREPAAGELFVAAAGPYTL
ncbi:MAG TPA: hypothetical protein VKQ30_18425, partial [Ktedonobacterales bacterium]|nr:hypothetical protein [Ktedonobacterales bacterium]